MSETENLEISRKQIATSNEVRAFVYQKLHVFEPYIKDETNTEVLIEQIDAPDCERIYLVHLTLVTEDGDLNAIGDGPDVYEAVTVAANQLMAQVEAIHNSVISNRERDLEIREAFQSQYLH